MLAFNQLYLKLTFCPPSIFLSLSLLQSIMGLYSLQSKGSIIIKLEP